MVRFSIILTCYNAERYINKCIESILSQTYKDFELVCVNDGSTDNTLKILTEYSKNDQRISVIEQANQGLSGARNTGIRNSHGQYVTFIDPDDWYDTDYLECVAAETRDEDVIQCGYTKILPSHNRTVRLFDKKIIVDGARMEDLKKCYIGPTNAELRKPDSADRLNSVCTKFVKLSIVKEHNLQFEDTKEIGPAEDLLFTYKYIMFCKSAVCLPIEGYNYYANPSSSTNTYHPELLRQWNELYKRLWEVVQDNADYKEPYYNRRRLSIIGLALNQIRCSSSLREQRRKISETLADGLYRDIYEGFDLTPMPLKWRLFFYCVKTKKYTLLTILLRQIG